MKILEIINCKNLLDDGASIKTVKRVKILIKQLRTLIEQSTPTPSTILTDLPCVKVCICLGIPQ